MTRSKTYTTYQRQLSFVVSERKINGDNIIELAYYVTPKKQEESKEFIKNLGRVEGIENINLFFDEE